MKTFLKSFPVPQQHGAWVMFLLPAFMAMMLSDHVDLSTWLVILGFVLIFLAHRPAVRFLRRRKYRRQTDLEALRWTILLGGSGALLLAALFILHQQWIALTVGAITGLALAFHLQLTLNKDHMSIPGEIIGVAGLTASAPIMYLHLHGTMDARGWVLWLINFLYFTGSIFYIKLKLRTQPASSAPNTIGKIEAGKSVLIYSLFLFVFVLAVTCVRGYSWYFLLAFIPFIVKSVTGVFRWTSKKQLKPKYVGFNEVGHALLFAVLALLGFYYT
ncbi:MAG: hypothetical protein GXO92_05250 [FCB group bacterium]|nr:hypothetical protein [FCB group bacterium]